VGCNLLDKIGASEFGTFAWVIDPEGSKVELWGTPGRPVSLLEAMDPAPLPAPRVLLAARPLEPAFR